MLAGLRISLLPWDSKTKKTIEWESFERTKAQTGRPSSLSVKKKNNEPIALPTHNSPPRVMGHREKLIGSDFFNYYAPRQWRYEYYANISSGVLSNCKAFDVRATSKNINNFEPTHFNYAMQSGISQVKKCPLQSTALLLLSLYISWGCSG